MHVSDKEYTILGGFHLMHRSLGMGEGGRKRETCTQRDHTDKTASHIRWKVIPTGCIGWDATCGTPKSWQKGPSTPSFMSSSARGMGKMASGSKRRVNSRQMGYLGDGRSEDDLGDIGPDLDSPFGMDVYWKGRNLRDRMDGRGVGGGVNGGVSRRWIGNRGGGIIWENRTKMRIIVLGNLDLSSDDDTLGGTCISSVQVDDEENKGEEIWSVVHVEVSKQEDRELWGQRHKGNKEWMMEWALFGRDFV
ncbi:hypothetical protein BJ684DRAFT_17260 [Piptocephalis cylindrospora]|uniref:Uncharacterized protein n=1 Tax=Piptocephalis cylindrospora TaxID=1907219 RepID=A0A4P9Y0N8_9FUNG|nr:hypothetical protein BJ684DRAFT_17260 [Piptocephalis cylindrospora]|eukprot:RKP12234.1 hypothetical protein BJ684DRAFT_17260 [Piptocephalis cylindrospora]